MTRSRSQSIAGPPKTSLALPVLRLLVVIGLGVSAYLVYLSVTGSTAAGCGEGEAGCDEILASAWSSVFGIPVAVLGLVAYIVLLFASVHASEQATQSQQKKAWQVMALVGLAAAASALWFIGLQVTQFELLCPYCMVVHICSLGIAGLTLWRVRSWWSSMGVLPVAILVGAQFLFPASPTIVPNDFQGTPIGGLELDTGPVLGDPGAPVQIAVLYDYNCGYCRSVHYGLKQALEQYDGKVFVRMLPTALDPACNHAVKKMNPNSATSCELTRLVLAVWIADPEKFELFDQRVVDMIEAGQGQQSAEEIVAALHMLAVQLVGRSKLDAALNDPRLNMQLDLAAELYARSPDPESGHRGLPRVVVGEQVYAGVLDGRMLGDLLDRYEVGAQ